MSTALSPDRKTAPAVAVLLESEERLQSLLAPSVHTEASYTELHIPRGANQKLPCAEARKKSCVWLLICISSENTIKLRSSIVEDEEGGALKPETWFGNPECHALHSAPNAT